MWAPPAPDRKPEPHTLWEDLKDLARLAMRPFVGILVVTIILLFVVAAVALVALFPIIPNWVWWIVIAAWAWRALRTYIRQTARDEIRRHLRGE